MPSRSRRVALICTLALAFIAAAGLHREHAEVDRPRDPGAWAASNRRVTHVLEEAAHALRLAVHLW